MRSKISAFFSFLLIVAAVSVALMAVNWLPMLLQKETLRRYNSIEEVKTRLNLRDVLVPAYFPQQVKWPPSEILAQSKPYPAVFMSFDDPSAGGVVLAISQAASEKFSVDSAIRIERVKERVPYRLKGRNAELWVGSCRNDEPCSRIVWMEGAYTVTVAMKSPPFELIRIAEGMLR